MKRWDERDFENNINHKQPSRRRGAARAETTTSRLLLITKTKTKTKKTDQELQQQHDMTALSLSPPLWDKKSDPRSRSMRWREPIGRWTRQNTNMARKKETAPLMRETILVLATPRRRTRRRIPLWLLILDFGIHLLLSTIYCMRWW
jgi:hypothetical protein